MKKISLLCLLIAIGLGFIYYTEKQPSPPPLQPQVRTPLLANLVGKKISSVEMYVEGASFTLVNKSKSWSLQEPQGAPVDQQKTETLIENLMSLTPHSQIETIQLEDSEQLYGLTPPSIIITLKGEFDSTVLRFGKEHAISKRRYLRLGNEGAIYLIGRTQFENLVILPKEIRESHPLRFSVEEVAQVIAIQHRETGTSSVILNRDDNRWTVSDEKQQAVADTILVEKTLRELSETKVANFIDNPALEMEKYGLDNPILTVRIKLKNQKKSLLFTVGRPKIFVPGVSPYFFKRSGETWAYQFEHPTFRPLNKPLIDFREKTVFPNTNQDLLTRVEFKETPEKTTQSIKLSKEMSPNLEALINELCSMRVLSFIALPKNLSQYGLEPPRITFDLFDSEGLRGTIGIGAPLNSSQNASDKDIVNDAPHYAQVKLRENAPDIVILSAASIEILTKSIRPNG